jgi:hypothetical protein
MLLERVRVATGRLKQKRLIRAACRLISHRRSAPTPLSVTGDADVLAVIPEGYGEVTEDEFNEAAGVIVLAPPEEEPPNGD